MEYWEDMEWQSVCSVFCGRLPVAPIHRTKVFVFWCQGGHRDGLPTIGDNSRQADV